MRRLTEMMLCIMVFKILELLFQLKEVLLFQLLKMQTQNHCLKLRNQFLNILQYTVIAIIPVIFLNKTVSKIIPEVDEEKPPYLMIMELLGQAILIFFGMTLIHRFVTYFPTYSKVAYAPFHTTNIILLFLIIAASFQTRIGEKTNPLLLRQLKKTCEVPAQ